MSVDPLDTALFLIVAFVLAGLVHSAWLRSARSQFWLTPLDGGLTFRGRRLFGENKTIRGFVAMVPAAGAWFAILSWIAARIGVDHGLWALTVGQYAALGTIAGMGFMLGELPNSFVKRQLDIAPGETARSSAAALACFAIDRIDSILGMLIAISIVVPTPWQTWAWVLLLGPAIHWSFSVLLFRLGVKARPA